MVLLNFFRAEAERRQFEKNVPDIIYAIEEPETSQHPEHQKKLIEAFIALSRAQHTQVILTTHSPSIVKMLEFEHLKLIKDTEHHTKEVLQIERNNLPYPSLNEVNFLAFNETDESYHNELYGYIRSEGWWSDFERGKATRPYKQQKSNGQTEEKEKILTEYIRHKIHHPENPHNSPFTHDELLESIKDMRAFIIRKQQEA